MIWIIRKLLDINDAAEKGVLLFVFVCLVSCCTIKGDLDYKKNNKATGVIEETLTYEFLGSIQNGILCVNTIKDLSGKECFLPPNITLDLRKGRICNGTLVGDGNKVICNEDVFDNVIIKGTWNIPNINTSYFKDLSKDNALLNVFALTNPLINNKVIIEKGDYYIDINGAFSPGIIIRSNTQITLDGNIFLKPNSFDGCDIIRIEGHDISLTGKGKIVGDKDSHKGETGEWGMGINIYNSNNISVSNISVNNCWGDCIYIGNESSNVSIVNCDFSDSRRQGVSVTSGNKIEIKNCRISNIKGTAPECAIDIEPNKSKKCENILIHGVEVANCGGGFLVYGDSKESHIGSVVIEKCNILDVATIPLQFINCEMITAKKCLLQKNINNQTIIIDRVKKIELSEIEYR